MKDILKVNVKYILIALVVCAACAGILIYKNKQKAKKEAQEDTSVSFTAQDYSSSLKNSASNTPSQQSAATGSSAYSRTLQVSNSKLVIESLGISAPITLNVDGGNQEEYLKSLENGVAHMDKTAQPGESGNTVLFGHSSYYKSKPGSYKTVFAKLDKLKSGDIIKIVSTGSSLEYRVSSSKTVAPEDVSVVAQDKRKSILTLITCWPPKTTDQRLIVVAELIK